MVAPVYPPGYPLLIALAAWLGLNVSNALVALNVVSVALAAGAAAGLSRYAFGRSEREAWVTAALVPSSYFVVRHTVNLMADVMFMGVATLAVLAMTRATQSAPRPVRALLVSAGLVGLAFLLRTTALALVLPLVVAAGLVWQRHVEHLVASVRSHPLAWSAGAAVVLAALAGAVVWALTATQYGRDAAWVYRTWGSDVLFNNVVWKLTEGGEMMLNAPAGRLEQVGVPTEALVGVGGLGVLVLGASLWTVRSRRPAWPVTAYVLAFVAMLVVWPGSDPRFWLGVWPVALTVVAAAVSEWGRLAVRAAQAWSAVFVAVALVAMALSVRISLSGPDFPERYSGTIHPIYRAAWTGSPPPDTSALGRRYYHVIARFSAAR